MGSKRFTFEHLAGDERLIAVLSEDSLERFLDPKTDRMFQAIPEVYGDLRGFVYVITNEAGSPCKIGKAADRLSQRLTDLQIGNPFPLRVAAAVGLYDADYHAVEQIAHKLAGKNFGRLSGEWFSATVPEALSSILAAVEFCGGTPRSELQCWYHGIAQVSDQIDQREQERRRKLRIKLGIDD